jgi:hypothetical protein
MAKFGRFSAGEKDPVESYEGDFLEHVSDDCIRVMRDGGEMPDAVLAIIHLQKGESVKTIDVEGEEPG